MRCGQAHPLLAKQLREPLSLEEELALRHHLAECAGCRTEVAELQSLEAALQQARHGIAVPSPVRVDTAAILQSGPNRRAATPWLPLLATSAGLAALGAAWVVQHPPTGRSRQPVAQTAPARKPVALQQVDGGARAPKRPEPRVAEGAPPRFQRNPVVPETPPERPVLRTHVRESGPAEPTQVARQFQRTQVVRQQVAPSQRAPKPGAMAQHPPEVPALQVGVQEPGLAVQRDGRVLPISFEPAPEPMDEAGTVSEIFRSDLRLKTRLALTESDQPLGELLTRLSSRLRVRLTAGREVADDKLTLLLRDRPAAEALTLAARHLGFRWHRLGEGYELRQDLAGRQREQTLLRNELLPIETQLNLAARWLQEPVERKKERVEEIETRLRGGAAGPEEQAKLAAEKQTVLDAWLSPASVDASLMLFRSLTPAQIDSMLAGAEFRYSSANGTLPPLIGSRVHDSTSILESLHGPLPKLQADVTLSLADVQDLDELPPSRRNRQLRLRTLFATVRGSKEDPHYWGGGWAPSIPVPVDVQPVVMAADPDLKRPVELTLPGPERQPASIYGGSMICAAQLGSVWPKRATLAEVAQAIQRATGLDVVADSFVFARIDPALLRGRRPLSEVLGKLAEELDYTWEKRGKLLLLRDRRFYRDRPAEVPERLLQPFRSRVLRQGELGLDELAGLAASLTDAQVRGMYRYWGWYLEGTGILPTDYFFGHRQHLRFWAALSPQQRAALRGGGSLRVAEMLPAQRRLWAEALTSPPETANMPSSEQRIPTPDEATLGSFSLRVTENQAALFIVPTPGAARQPGSSIIVEGPPAQDIRRYLHTDPSGPQLELAAPPLSLAGYTFQYSVGGEAGPLRKTRILIAPLQKQPHPRPEGGPLEKE